MKSSKIYTKALPGSIRRTPAGVEKISKHVTVEKTVTRSSADSISVTLTMTKTVSLTKTIPLCAAGAR